MYYPHTSRQEVVMRKVFLSIALVVAVAVFATTKWKLKAQSGPSYFYYYTYASYGTTQSLLRPTGIYYFPNGGGYLFIADTGHNKIDVLNGGVLNVIAGNGTRGHVDGTPATAEFNHPTSLTGAVANHYNPYVPPYHTAAMFVSVYDTFNHVIRGICIPMPGPFPGCSTANVSTAAGNGTSGLVNGTGTAAEMEYATGADGNASTSTTYFADLGDNAIREYSGTGTVTTVSSTVPGFVNGPLSSARFNGVASINSDGNGNYLIADVGNFVIRELSAAGTVTTLAGNGHQGYVNGSSGDAEFTSPVEALYNSNDGYIYVADSENNCIRRIDSAGNVSTYAGSQTGGLQNGSTAQALFDHPTGLTINKASNFLYVADTYNNVIRQIDLTNNQVSTLVQ